MPLKRSSSTGKPANSPSKSKRSRPSNTSTTPRKRTKVQRSIWNSKDDWDTLISESQLSTSSISIRPPRLRELPTLVKCCSESIARGFKRLWDVSGDGTGAEFKAAWGFLPNHLKEGIRDSVFRYWGGFLTVKILAEVFLIPPHLYLPGELLPSIASAEHVKSLIHPSEQREYYTFLSLKYASKASDLGISAIIYNLPNLESINLKGCNLAGEKTIKQILGRCSGLKRLNMKGTRITEGNVKSLLDRFGKRLEVFKVDSIFFENINGSFSSQPYPSLTHLSLPGDFLNSPSKDYRHRSKILSQSFGGYPQPRQSHPENIIQWYSFHIHFPKLTHLYLPGLLIPEDTLINLSPGLIKLDLGAGGPPVPVEALNHLLETQTNTLRSLKLGHIKSTKLLSTGIPDSALFTRLGEILSRCERLEEFSMKVDPGGSKDPMCEACMGRYSDLVSRDGLSGNWRKSLKKLSLVIPQSIDSSIFFPSDSHREDERFVTSPLEQLELPSAIIDDTHTFALALQGFPKLRSLDLSGTTITDEDMEIILQGCKLLSRIDLTSCRGINVRHRRNIFRAYEHN